MKRYIYVVTSGINQEGEIVEGIFSTLKAAKECKLKYGGDYWTIARWALDGNPDMFWDNGKKRQRQNG